MHTSSESTHVFIFDEAVDDFDSDRDKHNGVMLKFIRNLLRYVNLPVVLMSVDKSVCKMTQSAGNSRLGPRVEWCTVITDLPLINDAMIKHLKWDELLQNVDPHHSGLVTFLSEQIKTCIPWFAHIVMDALRVNITEINAMNVSAAALNALMHSLWQHVCLKSKKKFVFSLRCQFASLFKIHKLTVNNPFDGIMFGVRPADYPCDFLLFDHFGKIADSDLLQLDLGGSGLNYCGKLDVWRPSISFPFMKDNTFLYLSIFGGSIADSKCKSNTTDSRKALLEQFHPFPLLDGHKHLSTFAGYKQLKKDFSFQMKGNEEMLHHGNRNENHEKSSIDGLITIAVIVASHQNGVQGIKLYPFLSSFLSELVPRPIVFETMHDLVNSSADSSSMMYVPKMFEFIQVPYIVPSQDVFPALSELDGCLFGNIDRIKLSDKVGSIIRGAKMGLKDCDVFIEDKYCGGILGSSLLLYRLQKVSAMNVPVYIMIVKDIKDKFFWSTSRLRKKELKTTAIREKRQKPSIPEQYEEARRNDLAGVQILRLARSRFNGLHWAPLDMPSNVVEVSLVQQLVLVISLELLW
jgi:hypothetical protein